jgi:hypothetical protein
MSAFVSLFVHVGKSPNAYGNKSFEATCTDDGGLTLGTIIDAAMEHKSNACVRTDRRFQDLKDATLGDVMMKLGETDRKPAKCSQLYSCISLRGMVIPTEEEWRSVSGI